MAVLCCGHEASETLDAPFVSPWEDPRTWNTAPDSTILILGTGLTMVDAAIALTELGHRGPIAALSRRGLLPQAHRRVEPANITEGELPSPAALASFLGWLRTRAREEIRGGGDWRASLMVCAHTCRRSGAPCQARTRRRFLEHTRPWWDIHRHRMAPEVEAKIRALQEAASCESCPAISLKSTRNETAQALRSVRGRPKLWSAWRSPASSPAEG